MKAIVVVLALVIAARAFALDDTPANRQKEADRYLAATPPRVLLADMTKRVATTLPPEQRAIFEAALTKYIDIDALTKDMKEAMVRTFTAEELKALADFYGSPVGKAAMNKFGTYMAEVMPAVQAETMKAMGKARRAAAEAKAAASGPPSEPAPVQPAATAPSSSAHTP